VASSDSVVRYVPAAAEHKPDRSCCRPRLVRLQRDLYQRLRCRPYYHTDDYARKIAEHEGRVVTAVHTFLGAANDPALPASYTIEIDGKCFNLPSLYADPAAFAQAFEVIVR
jgi:hypothetical protein